MCIVLDHFGTGKKTCPICRIDCATIELPPVDCSTYSIRDLIDNRSGDCVHELFSRYGLVFLFNEIKFIMTKITDQNDFERLVTHKNVLEYYFRSLKRAPFRILLLYVLRDKMDPDTARKNIRF